MSEEVLNTGNESIKVTVKEEKLWNKNFFLLWQGQLVSSLGDSVYEIALGFWVLAVTGSTALMGTLMAASMIPRLVISPFAGVWVDRSDRKKLIVFMDLIRGVAITFVGIAAVMGFIEIWMVFAAGVTMGCCAAFFNPSMSSVMPDIVPKSKLTKANSAYGMATTGTNMIGNLSGGFLYTMLGAPLMFLINGISYLFSAFTEVFIHVPAIERDVTKTDFKEDFKEGFRFAWRFKGLRYTMMLACAINMFGCMGAILMLPMFQQTSSLGAAKYGVAAAAEVGGSLIGMLILSIVNIKYRDKFKYMSVFIIISIGTAVAVPFCYSMYSILPLVLVSGITNALFNTLFSTNVQLTVPSEKRGKVFSLMGTLSMGLQPLGVALGGVLAEVFTVRKVMFASMLICLVIVIALLFVKEFKKFMQFDPDQDDLEEIIGAE